MANPLLVGGRKFHIRAYALCVGALAAYVHNSPLALFAAAPYPQVLEAWQCIPVLDSQLHAIRQIGLEQACGALA